MVIVSGCKGGVGTTTVAAALVSRARVPVLAIDLTGTGDLGMVLGQSMVGAGDLVRRGAMGIQEVVRRQKSVFLVLVSEQDRALYPDAPMVIARAAQSWRAVVVDAGQSIPTMLLPIASALVLVTVPDVRAVRRARQIVGLRVSKIVVENMVEEESLFPHAYDTIPFSSRTSFRALMRGRLGEVAQKLSTEMFPVAMPAAASAPEEGIVRSVVRRLAGS